MSFIESFANDATTTLSGSITSGATSLVVNSASRFPTSPQFRLIIDSEYLLVQGVTGTTFSVVRGVEGSTAASHSNGASVSQILTSGGLVGVAGSVNLSDTNSNLPSTGTVGRSFYPTDGSCIYREGTSGWSAFGPIYPISVPPSLGSWTQVNMGSGAGSGVATQNGSAIHILAPANATSAQRILAMSAPTTGYTITALILPDVWTQSFPLVGVGWRDSSNGKKAFLRFGGDTNSLFNIYSATTTADSAGTYATYSSTQFSGAPCRLMWVRLKHDGTNRTISYSWNGVDFVQLDQRAYNDFPASTMNPDQVIILADSLNGTYYAAITLYSWQITQP